MFTKLLKHEWRATRGTLGILCLVCLGAGLLGGLTMRYLIWVDTAREMQHDVIIVLSALAMVAAVIAVGAAGVATLFLLIGRFYKSRFTDEGYLTFTLPVNVHQNLLSSMVNSVIGMIIMFVVIFAAVMMWLFIGLSALEGFTEALRDVLPRFWESVREVFGEVGLGNTALFLSNVLISGICELVVLMLSVTIGSIAAKKHKVLAAVGVYYGIHVAMSIGSAILSIQVSAIDLGGRAFFCYTLLITAAIAVAGYFLMYWLMDKKLNLN